MSSDIASRPIHVKKYGVIFAGAQKIWTLRRHDRHHSQGSRRARRQKSSHPSVQYRTHIKEKSLYHTPPTFAVYIVGLVLEGIESEGGIPGMVKRK